MTMENKSEGKELIALEAQKPREILTEAIQAAKSLKAIVMRRKKPLIIGGKQYLFFEDWQTLGRFYGITAKVTQTEEIIEEDGELLGFLAKASAIREGNELSAAEAECCFDELNWKDKPRFQLRSMAQTRACAKALRNCLAWIAVLAGYEGKPAEELEGEQPKSLWD